ncbi:MAG: (2Fe-2S) ferredoxin domain-containing protein [Candidatus Izemoplasmatales bacterium]|jgi:NADP-reducing hydrogenase subunit HndB
MKSIEELIKLRDSARKNINMRLNPGSIRIQIGMGTCGIAAGAKHVYQKFQEEIREHNLKNIILTPVGCMGECAFEPLVEILESNGNHTIYCQVSERVVEDIVEEHIIGGTPIEKFFLSAIKR